MPGIPDVTDDSFAAEVLEGDRPALVDFWGDHCPACRQISPILAELAERYAERVKVVKIHAAENVATASRYQILSMPTVLGIRDGMVVRALQGARPKAEFEALIEELLA